MGQPNAPVTDFLLAGARGILRAEASPHELLRAIQTVVAGQCSVGRKVLDDVVGVLRRTGPSCPLGPPPARGLGGASLEADGDPLSLRLPFHD